MSGPMIAWAWLQLTAFCLLLAGGFYLLRVKAKRPPDNARDAKMVALAVGLPVFVFGSAMIAAVAWL